MRRGRVTGSNTAPTERVESFFRATVVIAALGGLAIAAARDVLIIGHRGASGHRPEHTLASYELAIDQGADYIEPDLVSTKDGILVARHENEIGGTTDVETKFPGRKATKKIDGVDVSGWFTEDFTLAELKRLRARERLAFRSHEYDDRFEIPAFDEVLDLAARRGRARGRAVGVYPETKHPSYFKDLGLPLEPRLVGALDRRGLSTRGAPVFVQSFEPGSLRELRAATKVRLVQLVDATGRPWDFARGGDPRTYADLARPEGLKAIATWADGVGLHRRLVIPAAPDGRLSEPTRVIADAHAAGLFVHVWTLRREPAFLSPTYAGDFAAEFRQFAALGADGIFTDFPDVGVAALRGTRPR